MSYDYPPFIVVVLTIICVLQISWRGRGVQSLLVVVVHEVAVAILGCDLEGPSVPLGDPLPWMPDLLVRLVTPHSRPRSLGIVTLLT